MRLPKGLKAKFDKVKDGRIYFTLQVTRFYLFKLIMKIAWENIRKPAVASLIFLFAFYWLVRNGKKA